MMRRQSFKLRNELQIVLIIVLLLVFRTSGAVAQKADLTMEPIANGASWLCPYNYQSNAGRQCNNRCSSEKSGRAKAHCPGRSSDDTRRIGIDDDRRSRQL